MSELTIGQDVLVESDALYDGEAFIASVDEETRTLVGNGVYINLRDRADTENVVALVPREDVITLTEVFDATETFKTDTRQ